MLQETGLPNVRYKEGFVKKEEIKPKKKIILHRKKESSSSECVNPKIINKKKKSSSSEEIKPKKIVIPKKKVSSSSEGAKPEKKIVVPATETKKEEVKSKKEEIPTAPIPVKSTTSIVSEEKIKYSPSECEKIASELGYLIRTIPNIPEAQKLIEELEEQYTVIDKWNLNVDCNSEVYKTIAKEWKSTFGECLKCQSLYEITNTNKHFFCLTCVDFIKFDGCIEKKIKKVSETDRKKKIKECLETITGHIFGYNNFYCESTWSTGFPCKKCKRVFVSDETSKPYKQFCGLNGVVNCYTPPSYLRNYIRDDYYCTICLDELFREKGFITSTKSTYPIPNIDLSSPYYLSNEDIAFKLGFLTKKKDDKNKAMYYTTAWRHGTMRYIHIWSIPEKILDDKEKEKLWPVIMTRKSCIKCICRHDKISFETPYCNNCSIKMNKDITNNYNIIEDRDHSIIESTPPFLSIKARKCAESLGFTTVTGCWNTNWCCSVCKRNSVSLEGDIKYKNYWDTSDKINAYVLITGNCGTYCCLCLDKAYRDGGVY